MEAGRRGKGQVRWPRRRALLRGRGGARPRGEGGRVRRVQHYQTISLITYLIINTYLIISLLLDLWSRY